MLENLLEFIESNKTVNDKSRLATLVKEKFALTRDRSVFYNSQFAIRFSKSESRSCSNTVAALSRLQKYDDRPFIVCLVIRNENILRLANSTFLKKISHSSQNLRADNIVGNFNYSDILKEFNAIQNSSENFEELFEIHRETPFEENLARLVEATNGIEPTGKKFEVTEENRTVILDAPLRAKNFSESVEYNQLKNELDGLVKKFEKEILIASKSDIGKIRGNIIEYLIAGKDEKLKQNLIDSLLNETDIPIFKNDNELGDYTTNFANGYHVTIDIKSKKINSNSNPKAYNLDKILSFLSGDNSIFMFYFVGIDSDKILNPVLVSMFQEKILGSTSFITHWAGRNSRGVSQLNGSKIKELFAGANPTNISLEKSVEFLENLIKL